MKLTSLKHTILGLFVMSLPATALSQVSSMRQSTFHPTTVAVEAKPLPFALMATPGTASLGASAELSADNNFATFINAYLVDANLPTRLRQEGEQDETPVIHKMQGYSADLGARYYTRTGNVDSWYGGAKVGYALLLGQWQYKDELVDQSTRSVTPGVEGGYRWMWVNNFLVRLGIGADGNIIQENSATAATTSTSVTDDAADTIKGYAQVAVVPRVDFGVGYAF